MESLITIKWQYFQILYSRKALKMLWQIDL